MPAPVNPNRSLLDMQQILQRVMDESTDKLRVDSSVTIDGINGEVFIELDATDGDNVALSSPDGSKKVTVTTVEDKQALDVNIVSNGGLNVPNVINIDITNANTEHSFIIPSGTRKFSVKLRGQAELKIAYNSGSSNTSYISIPPGCGYVETDLALLTNRPIFFQTPKNSQVLEILTWG